MVNDTEPQPARSGTKLLLLIAGCAGCALLAVAAVVAVVGFGVFSIVKAAEPVKADARRFLAEAAAGDTEAAYGHFSESLRKKLGKPAFRTMVEENPDFFAITDSTFNNVANMNGVWSIRGTLVGKSGKVHNAVFRYRTEDGVLKLAQFVIKDDPIRENE